MKEKFFKKNISLRITICLFLFIPLVLAIVFGLGVDPYSVPVNSLHTLKVTTPQGVTRIFDDEEVLSIYSSITDGAKEITKDFRDFSAEKPFKLVFSESNSEPLEYKLYVSENNEDFVYVSPDDRYFLIAPDVADMLLTREEFVVVDTALILPSAKIAGFGELMELNASSYTWKYIATDGSHRELNADSTESTNPVVKFDTADGALKMEFDKNPDSLRIRIFNDTTIFFDDNFDKLAGANMLSFDHDEKISASVTAEWYELEGSQYSGVITYNFDLLFDILSTYNIVDKKTLPIGDFTVLRISDHNDGEQLTVINQMGLPEKMNVYDLEDENVKIAFIPFGCHLESGEYTLTLRTELGHEQTLTVSTELREEFDTQSVLINEETDKALSKAFSKETVKQFDELVAKLTSESVNAKLYDGKFEYPTGWSKIVDGGASFGTRREVFSFNSAGDIYVSRGLDLECMDMHQIKAANHGTVVFAGETALYGNTVIIDHGYGILSYYGNLSSIKVKVGDSVTKQDSVLGIAGSTGFACVEDGATAKTSTMCHYAVSLNGVFVAPKSVYNGIFLK